MDWKCMKYKHGLEAYTWSTNMDWKYSYKHKLRLYVGKTWIGSVWNINKDWKYVYKNKLKLYVGQTRIGSVRKQTWIGSMCINTNWYSMLDKHGLEVYEFGVAVWESARFSLDDVIFSILQYWWDCVSKQSWLMIHKSARTEGQHAPSIYTLNTDSL